MCNHLHKEIGQVDLKTGFAPETCLDCGKNLGQKPATFLAILNDCAKRKISVHYSNPAEPLTEPYIWDNLKRDKTRF